MNNFITRLSRRERLYVLLAAVALFAGGILYPVYRVAESYRQSKLEELEAAHSLRASYQTMLRTADQIRMENSQLKDVLSQADGLLFDRTGNDVMMEASIIKLMNQLAPDLSLDVSMTRPSLHGVPGQLNFSVRGNGRYPEILNFFYQLETHRPLIVIDEFNMAVQGGKRPPGKTNGQRPQPQTAQKRKVTVADEPSEPRMRLQMTIHINCRAAEGAGK